MANLQTQFIKFHNTIKLDFDDSQSLRDKRELIVENLRDGLKKLIPTYTPTFTPFNQGSYHLATGVYPLPGEDFDIDVGVIFNFSKSTNKPVQVKEWVYNALIFPGRTVEIKRPCVRVQYHQYGAKSFHVDLAIYSSDKDYFGNVTTHLAKGLPNSSDDKKVWEISEPSRLKEILKSKWADGADRDQFRRVIRYLKRWKDYNFSSVGAERPTGIALTACTYNLFCPQKTLSFVTYTPQYDDLRALQTVVNGMVGMFFWYNRISVNLPVAPGNDLFAKMTDNQMLTLKTKLISLSNALSSASADQSTYNACATLRKVFGSDFLD